MDLSLGIRRRFGTSLRALTLLDVASTGAAPEADSVRVRQSIISHLDPRAIFSTCRSRRSRSSRGRRQVPEDGDRTPRDEAVARGERTVLIANNAFMMDILDVSRGSGMHVGCRQALEGRKVQAGQRSKDTPSGKGGPEDTLLPPVLRLRTLVDVAFECCFVDF
ncbi:hypothetical protein L596_019123 [Steinernema carpocapsae]|uniref:Uncharacterized protein n=1 Tax=Steinernema carpocapsae TaxID=34508 RepID=A0A4U5N7C4_STECR|nr:hypothetical protein L596_019123 [Steinernema carpocapsae]